jgi:hypothetical protein
MRMLSAPDETEVEMETFLVQVWVPANDASRRGDLRGLVRHVATGTECPFVGDQEVLDLLHRISKASENDRGDGG